MGFRVGDEQIMQVPLDWIGFHYYTRRIVSDVGGQSQCVSVIWQHQRVTSFCSGFTSAGKGNTH